MSIAARIDELRKKFDEHPRRYFAPLANEYRKAGDLTQAIALCREHLPQQPGHMSGYIVFGQALFESGAMSEARTVFEQALALDPDNFIALRHLGDIAKGSGDVSAARRWYERVLDADPRNDDIAAQLASLGPLPTPPIGSPPIPVFVGKDRLSTVTPTPLLAAPDAGPSGLTLSLSTPDAGMRAIDLDALSTRRSHPQPLDLDAIEQRAEPNAGNVAPDLDAFGFPAGTARRDDTIITPDPDPDFPSGIVTAAWPDTSDLVARVVSPRAFTPVDVPITSDAVAAFGREAGDPPSAEEDIVPIAELLESDPEPAADVWLGDDIVRGEDEWLGGMTDAEDPRESSAAVGDTSPGTTSSELTWLVTPASNDALQWISTNDQVTDDTERASIQEIAKVFAEDALSDAPALPREPSSWLLEVDEHDDEDDDRAQAPGGDAPFVTATMAELLVSQGFIARAIEVYEELLAAHPENPELLRRLTELRSRSRMTTPTIDAGLPSGEAHMPLAYGTPAWVNSVIPSAEGGEAEALLYLTNAVDGRTATPSRNVRETFARLAAKRARNRVSPVPAEPEVQDGGLDALFGRSTAAADDAAARELAVAFAPLGADSGSDGGFRATPAASPAFVTDRPAASRSTTPPPAARPFESASEDPFAFDRFFPDPAVVAPVEAPPPSSSATADLADFSAWLKGLGSQ